MCQINAFLMEVLPMSYTLSLLVLMINRTRAVRQYISTVTKYKKIDGKTGRVKVLLTFIWFICMLLCSPLLLNIIETWPFPARYSCHAAHEMAPIYGIVTSVFPYLVSLLGFLICLCLIYGAVKVKVTSFNP